MVDALKRLEYRGYDSAGIAVIDDKNKLHIRRAVGRISVLESKLNNGNPLPTVVWYIVALVFIWTSIVAAITSFAVGKWLPTAGAYARFLLLGLFTISVVIYATKHGWHGAGSYAPTAGADHIFQWTNVALGTGANTITATGTSGATTATDMVTWTRN